MCPSTHLCGDRLGAAPCEFDDDESNLWHIGKALFHRSHPFGASWSVGGTMPPARPPLASQPVSRLNTTLVFNFKHDRVYHMNLRPTNYTVRISWQGMWLVSLVSSRVYDRQGREPSTQLRTQRLL